MGALAILDIAQISKKRSGNQAQHFAAVAFSTRARIGHHPARSTDYGDAKPIKSGQFVLAKVGAATWATVALHLFNHAPAFHILKVNVQLLPDLSVFQSEILNITLVLQNGSNGGLDI